MAISPRVGCNECTNTAHARSGVAAVSAADPGAMCADEARTETNETATEGPDSEMPAQAGGPDDAGEDGSEAADCSPQVGPSGGLPEQAPDQVSEIHDAIESFLNDTIVNLGETISNIVDTPEDAGDGADGEQLGEESSEDEQMDDSGNETAAPVDVPA